jgi:uncharacterized protein (TIGR02466 family)
MNDLIQCFPTSFYYQKNILSEQDRTKLISYILDIKKNVKKGGNEWLVDTFNSLGTLNVLVDKNFNVLNKRITEQVNKFNNILGSDYVYKKANEGWFNVYDQNDHQEFHTHPGQTYSVVYYLQVEEDIEKRSSIVFKHPYDDMKPLKGNVKLNNLNFQRMNFKPENNSLLIFRSYLQHFVEKHRGHNPRITLAYNFD